MFPHNLKNDSRPGKVIRKTLGLGFILKISWFKLNGKYVAAITTLHDFKGNAIIQKL